MFLGATCLPCCANDLCVLNWAQDSVSVEVSLSGGVDVLHQYECKERTTNSTTFGSSSVAITRAFQGSALNGTFSLSKYDTGAVSSRWRYRFPDNANCKSYIDIWIDDVTNSLPFRGNAPDVLVFLRFVLRQRIEPDGTYFDADNITSPNVDFENSVPWVNFGNARTRYDQLPETPSAVLYRFDAHCKGGVPLVTQPSSNVVRLSGFVPLNGVGIRQANGTDKISWPTIIGSDWTQFKITYNILPNNYTFDDGFGTFTKATNTAPGYYPWIEKDQGGNSSDYQITDYFNPADLPALDHVDFIF